MMEIEKLRREQAEMIANVQTQVLAEQTKIAAEHSKTAAIQADILGRIEKGETKADSETGRFNKLFAGLAVAAVLLALSGLFLPNGLPRVSYRGNDESQPIVAILVTATHTPTSTPTPTIPATTTTPTP